MKLKIGDGIAFGGDKYEVVSIHPSSDSYWVKELDPYLTYNAQYLWSQDFIDKEIKAGAMVVHAIALKQTTCWHNYKQLPMFRFYHEICVLCGHDKGEIDWTRIKKETT